MVIRIRVKRDGKYKSLDIIQLNRTEIREYLKSEDREFLEILFSDLVDSLKIHSAFVNKVQEKLSNVEIKRLMANAIMESLPTVRDELGYKEPIAKPETKAKVIKLKNKISVKKGRKRVKKT